jgi:hypothetical protein
VNRPTWIVCEQTSRWASALRLALGQEAVAADPPYLLREVRSLAELSVELASHPTGFVAVEVRRNDLGGVLTWLAEAERKFPRARCFAMLGRSLLASESDLRSTTTQSLQDVGDALREAGALAVVASPRRLADALQLGRRHAAATESHATLLAEQLPLVERLWATLPWQKA